MRAAFGRLGETAKAGLERELGLASRRERFGARAVVVGTGISGPRRRRQLHFAGHEVSVFEESPRIGGHAQHRRRLHAGGRAGPSTPASSSSTTATTPHFQPPSGRARGGDAALDDGLLGVRRQGSEWAATPSASSPTSATSWTLVSPMLLDLRASSARSGADRDNGSGPSLRESASRAATPSTSWSGSIGPAGLRRLVGRSESCGRSRPVRRPSSSSNHGSLQLLGRPRWHTIAGGSRRYVEPLAAPFAARIRTSAPSRLRAPRITSRSPGGAASGAGRERFDHVMSALPFRPGARDARRSRPGRARGPRGDRLPGERDASCTPNDCHASPAGGLGELELSPGEADRTTTVTYHMNRLQSLDADREFLVTLNRSGPTSTRRGSSRRSPTRTGLHAVGRSPPSGGWERDQRRGATHFCGGVLALGLPRGRRLERLRACEAMGALERGREVETAEGWRSRHDGSALYEGSVEPPAHGAGRALLPLPVVMALLDLDELPGALDRHPLWSARRPAPVRFRRRDHLGGAAAPLREAARDLVEERTAVAPGGPVRLLTTPRFCGIGFNPVSVPLSLRGGRA